jgi:hypothetical protein
MKIWSALVGLVCVTLVAFVATPVSAKSKATKFKPKEVEVHPTVVTAVTADAITVSVDKASKTYGVTQFTEIKLNGQPAKLADLKAGMTVNVTMGLDPLKASRIEAAGTPAARKR